MEKSYGEVAGYLTHFPDAWVLPIAIVGTDTILPRGRLVPIKGVVGLNIGSLTEVKALEESIPKGIDPAKKDQELIDAVMRKVADLLPERYKGYYAVQR